MTVRSLVRPRPGLAGAAATAAVGLALLLTLALGSARSAPVAGDDDDEKAEARAVARQAFVENCLMCHGAELTERQRLTPKQWAAEVEKMIGWGTPLPPDRKDGLIAWLSESYPATGVAPPAARITPEAALALDHQDDPAAEPAADPARGAALFTQHCVACHGAEARGGEVGINLVARPVLARGAEFHDTLRRGRRRMPSFAPVLDDRAQSDLLAYLRTR